ncbi:CoA transferase [Amycolatopsis sp. NPDC005232]|uniref:CaiB/BaiF CoA transferase family protein n=1 Tax=Amycolatopsis sp. NPDC005232 TaxID=3157027 RepID=UPI00339DCCB1
MSDGEPHSERGGSAPLEGVRVLDLTRVLAGPFGTMILGDLGADVLKVEEPGHGDGVRDIGPFYADGTSHYFLAINRNKRSIAIDLKTDAGRDLVLDLAAHSDVVIENFRPGVMERLGLGFDRLVERRPDVILCSISGFGSTGPMSGKPSFDLVSQALSGVMSITGEPGSPPTKMGLPMGDLAGGLWGSIAVLAALQRRHHDPTPQHIDLSLLEGLVGLLGYLGQLSMLTGESPRRMGSDHHSVVPYGRFEVADGHLVIALHVGSFWRGFCRAIGREDLADDPRFRSTRLRNTNREALLPIVQAILRTKTRAEWQKLLGDADVPHAPLLDVTEALAHEQIQARGVLRPLRHPSAGTVEVVGPVVRFAGESPPRLRPSPQLGEHGRELLSEVLGMADEAIDALAAAKVLSLPGEHERAGTRSADENRGR